MNNMVVSKAELKREVNALANKLANCNTNGRRKGNRKRRPRGARAANSGNVASGFASQPNPVVASSGRRRNRNRRNGMGASIGNGGRIVLTRDELLVTVATTANKTESLFSKLLKPSSDLMPFLFRLSACYQRIRWRSFHITWRPAVGTNTNGIITYGIAYNNQKITDRNGVTSLTPVNDHPVWQSGNPTPLVVPQNMLMTRNWYELNGTGTDPFDVAIGTFYCGFTHDSAGASASRGEFWVRYTVEMEGTNNA